MDNLRPTQFDSPLNRRERVFLGIGPAPSEWAEALHLWRNQLDRRMPRDIRWTSAENLHLTLRFFGSISQTDILTINGRLDLIAKSHRSFVMESMSLALFPEPDRPRVLAISIREQTLELFRLEQTIQRSTSEIGQPPEHRDFHAHVTFGRVISTVRAGLIRSMWKEGASPELQDWPVKEILLFKSDLQKGGSVYTVLKRFPLGDACVSGGDL
jgi:2'-5' RNA ligase